MEEIAPGKNTLRRLMGLVVCSLPIVLPIACAIYPRDVTRPRYYAGMVLVIGACLVGCLNFYLSFARPWMYRRMYGSMDGYRFLSGLPVVGTFFLVAGSVIGFGSTTIGLLGILSALFDSGGLLWFPVLTWKDSSFWDAPWISKE